MTTPVLVDPHRARSSSGGFGFSAADEGSSLDMPVLFQLSDLAQLRVLRPATSPQPERKSPGKISKSAVGEGASATAGPDATPADPTCEAAPTAAAVEVSKQAIGESLPPLDVVVPGTDQPLAARALASQQQAGTPVADSPTIRERARLRERRQQTVSKADWFQTQGKYIVIVFLILLVGTIYVARNTDDSPASPTADSSLLVDTDPEETLPDETTFTHKDQDQQLAVETTVTPPQPETPAVTAAPPATDSFDEMSPADATETPFVPAADLAVAPEVPGTSPQISLQAPVSTASPHTTGIGEESLFPWAGREEPRVAARSPGDTSSSSAQMPSTNPHYRARPSSPRLNGTASQPPAPGIDPAAPSTAPDGRAAPVVYPVADPITYPVVDPATQRSYPPPSGPADGNAAPASHENRVPPALPPSGTRHERTGSGLY